MQDISGRSAPHRYSGPSSATPPSPLLTSPHTSRNPRRRFYFEAPANAVLLSVPHSQSRSRASDQRAQQGIRSGPPPILNRLKYWQRMCGVPILLHSRISQHETGGSHPHAGQGADAACYRNGRMDIRSHQHGTAEQTKSPPAPPPTCRQCLPTFVPTLLLYVSTSFPSSSPAQFYI